MIFKMIQSKTTQKKYRITIVTVVTSCITLILSVFFISQANAQDAPVLTNPGAGQSTSQEQSWRFPTASQKPKLEKAASKACDLKYSKSSQWRTGCKEGVKIYAQNRLSISAEKACEKVSKPGCAQGFLLAAETLVGINNSDAGTPRAAGESGATAGKTKSETCSKYKNAANKRKCEKAFDAQKKELEKAPEEIRRQQEEIAETNDPALDCIENPDKCNLMKKYINPIITFLTAFVGIAVTIGIISGGIRMASSADDPSKLAAGKKQIGTAIVALLAMMILYAAIRWLTPSV